ncbi:MAG: HupU protein [Gammaproteobacteria bacterium]|nr:HupU protein [Gammaproteobacteria bacterium]MCF6361908.1 HupU protein [Gammaproteobacteria bacterium]
MTKPASAKVNLLWLQSGGCGGCSQSLLCAEAPDLIMALETAGIHLLWHPSLSETSGADFRGLLGQIKVGNIRLDILCLEGSVIRGPDGSGRFHMMAGSDRSMMAWIEDLARQARYTVAVGSCAAYGGITAAGSNPSDAIGLQFQGDRPGGLLGAGFKGEGGLPVINIAGCPTHPGWVTETLMQITAGEMNGGGVDHLGRPRSYANHLVHHGCPRNEYYEYKASAEKPSDLGCLMENLGCLGTQAHGDCNTRLWNGEGSCLRGGYACINCTAPGFEEPGHPFQETPKIAGIPIGLPVDMPKAWFVALASLSKAATPRRLKENAVSDHLQRMPDEEGERP